jgi:hypothetical protein
MTATLNPVTVPQAEAQGTRTTPLWRIGAGAGVVAAVATTAVAIAAKAIDIPMKAAPRTEEFGRAIPLNGFAVSTLMCTAVGTLLAIALYRYAKRPARTFLAATVVLTIASFAGPITTGYATTATRLVLALTHVVAAAIVIPALHARLAEGRK